MALSSPGNSYHTPDEGRSIFSSSLSPPPDSSRVEPEEVQYLPTKPLPDELVQQITVYFEENLHYQAITLLSSILAAGTASRGPVFVPPPYHLAFILTLSLHPKFTIHALVSERLRTSAVATTYLTSLLGTVGPISGGFTKAYQFNNLAYMRGGRKRTAQSQKDSDDESTGEPVESDLAQSHGFFKRADDFWAALGWAFTCSVSHPLRWETWQFWCSHVITTLEQDWKIREAKNKEGDDENWSRKTLLAQYVGQSSSAKIKRIVRAIFADNTGSEFSEIWKDETRRKRKKVLDLAHQNKLDIEAGLLGDYGDHSSDDGENISEDEEAGDVKTNYTLGPPEALSFRIRMLALLSLYSITDTENFTSLESLYTVYLTHLRPLPLQTLQILLRPQYLAHFTPYTSNGLVQYLARSFLEASAPPCSMDALTWTTISNHYAPFASTGQTGSSTVGDNGKLSICIEALIGLVRRKLGFSPLQGYFVGDLESGKKEDVDGLWVAIEKGCKKRSERSGVNARRAKKGEAGAEFDFETMRDFEVAFLKGAKLRMAVLMGMKL